MPLAEQVQELADSRGVSFEKVRNALLAVPASSFRLAQLFAQDKPKTRTSGMLATGALVGGAVGLAVSAGNPLAGAVGAVLGLSAGGIGCGLFSVFKNKILDPNQQSIGLAHLFLAETDIMKAQMYKWALIRKLSPDNVQNVYRGIRDAYLEETDSLGRIKLIRKLYELGTTDLDFVGNLVRDINIMYSGDELMERSNEILSARMGIGLRMCCHPSRGGPTVFSV